MSLELVDGRVVARATEENVKERRANIKSPLEAAPKPFPINDLPNELLHTVFSFACTPKQFKQSRASCNFFSYRDNIPRALNDVCARWRSVMRHPTAATFYQFVYFGNHTTWSPLSTENKMLWVKTHLERSRDKPLVVGLSDYVNVRNEFVPYIDLVCAESHRWKEATIFGDLQQPWAGGKREMGLLRNIYDRSFCARNPKLLAVDPLCLDQLEVLTTDLDDAGFLISILATTPNLRELYCAHEHGAHSLEDIPDDLFFEEGVSLPKLKSVYFGDAHWAYYAGISATLRPPVLEQIVFYDADSVCFFHEGENVEFELKQHVKNPDQVRVISHFPQRLLH
ncbi:uncharacterized protein SCHCODRAFT_02748130 [Schizophyllum commune H4-8]|uniref:F-box domain-containing protein n=1 Tax=Schizophyllum commune (strain H4-8 / FGSC 9210) TaxID=578458 RepID=D8PL19_SCHCM|nr:uncharacterized protein SCHCODRAFT_02748130 [Schizophyllum commune H4-8]KAI5894278.1 hypothetical protein SCHCODRAFT_02748130 [Schizophyllum commune H4-8]